SGSSASPMGQARPRRPPTPRPRPPPRHPMKTIVCSLAPLLCILAVAAAPRQAAAAASGSPAPTGSATSTGPAGGPFTGEKTSWHGFDRYDFLMDEAKLTLQPIKAAADEKDGIKGQVKGQLRCVVVVPRQAAPGKPWSWRGYYFNHEPQAEIELLKRGFHIGYIQVDTGKHWEAWYDFLTEKHGLSKKPAFVGMSRGGRNAFTWATTHPDRVSSLYVDNPAVSRDSLAKLGDLARHDVPMLQVCGSIDPLL